MANRYRVYGNLQDGTVLLQVIFPPLEPGFLPGSGSQAPGSFLAAYWRGRKNRLMQGDDGGKPNRKDRFLAGTPIHIRENLTTAAASAGV
jgi:hypothetical protein